eukprot:403340700
MRVTYMNRKTTSDFQPKQFAPKLNQTQFRATNLQNLGQAQQNVDAGLHSIHLRETLKNNSNLLNQILAEKSYGFGKNTFDMNKQSNGLKQNATLSRDTLIGSRNSCYEDNPTMNMDEKQVKQQSNNSQARGGLKSATRRRFFSPHGENQIQSFSGVALNQIVGQDNTRRNFSMQRTQLNHQQQQNTAVNTSLASIQAKHQQALNSQVSKNKYGGSSRVDDKVLHRLIEQEKYLDSQLKMLEMKYNEIEVQPNSKSSNISQMIKTSFLENNNHTKENLMQRAEKAHQELRNYFAKLENNQPQQSQQSSDSTAEDNFINNGNYNGSHLPPIDNLTTSSVPSTANYKPGNGSGIISRTDTASESNLINISNQQLTQKNKPIQSLTRVQMSFKDQQPHFLPDTLDNQLRKQMSSAEELNINKIEDYQLIRLLGSGAYATVKLGQNKKTKQKVAIKIYPKYKLNDQTKKKAVQREILCMKKLEHPNIVKLYENFETAKEVYLIQEFINGTSLYQYIKSKTSKRILPEDQARFFFKQLCESMRYLHSMNICHRDLKLENILIDDRNNIKLIDFGFSICTPPDQKLKIFCGTPSYMAPEIVQKKDYDGFATDIWSLGIILYVILSGNYPFKGQNERDLFSKISRGLFHMPETIPFEAKRLIQKMLSVDGSKRPSAKELCADRWLNFPRAIGAIGGSFISQQQFYSNQELV